MQNNSTTTQIQLPGLEGAPQLVVNMVIIVIMVIAIFLVGRFIKFFIRRIGRIPPDARNGVYLIITLFQIFALFSGTAIIFSVDANIIISSSAFFATAIGFASTTIAANLVGGFYIMITRPFGIGDFIQVKGTSGVVLEIGLNYTSLLRIDRTVVTLPNSTLLNASLLNSNISIDDETRKHEQSKTYKFSRKGVSIVIPDLLTTSVKDTFTQDEIIRYSTMVQLKLNQYTPALSLKDVKSRLELLCDEFTKIFGFKPRFYFGEHIFRQNTHLVITSKDTDTLIENYPLFMEGIMKSVFSELQEGS